MKFASVIVIGTLLTAAYSINASPLGRKSLPILEYLYSRSYDENTTVRIECEVENATSYHWYKDEVELKNNNSLFTINGNKLFIDKFTKKFEGSYTCEGRDGKGNVGSTFAYLSLEDPCTLPTILATECTYLDARKCRVTDYPPKAESLEIEVQIDAMKRPWPTIWLLANWAVPRQGRTSIWGWQITITGKSIHSAGDYTCYQVNKKYDKYPPLMEVNESYAFPVRYPDSVYEVAVMSLPNLPSEKDYEKIVVRKDQKTPKPCVLRNIKACCESFINVTIMGEDNRAILNWTTFYPGNLNVTIDGFVIEWRIDEATNGLPVYEDVVVDAAKSNYTFRNLNSKCGRNYTIWLRAKFTNDPEVLGCEGSLDEEVFYRLPDCRDRVPAPSEKTEKSTATATAGFTIAAILGGIAIAAFIYICLKKKSDPEEEAFGMENGKIENIQIISSSSSTGLHPELGRLNAKSCWSAGENDSHQWIQVDLGKERVVTAIATQGRMNAEEWVVSYEVSYSLDRETFEKYKINGKIELFKGNGDKNTVVKNVLSPPITARLIRIHPQSWYNHISMRMELYGSKRQRMSTDDVRVLILNSNHCDQCIHVVRALAALLMETGRIHCEVDIFAPMQEKSQGLARWNEEMISKCDYVIIPWMCKINLPTENNKCKDMNTLIFLSTLEIINAELVRNRNEKDKFIPVCLDHCSVNALPPMQVRLLNYNIPSRINDLVIELLGRTRLQPDSKRPLLEFVDDDYKSAKRKLEQAVNSCHKKSVGKNNNENFNGTVYRSLDTESV